jgi:hypothetical protein
MDKLFTIDPKAYIIDGYQFKVIYDGRQGFLDNAPDTYHAQVGSQMFPQTFGAQCECDI